MKRVLTALLLAACVAMLVIPALPHRPASEAYTASGRALAFPEIPMPEGTISVNWGDLEELTGLPGVGETLGQRIIDERERGGLFYYPEDLLAVRGIGEKTLEGMRGWLDMTLPDEDE